MGHHTISAEGTLDKHIRKIFSVFALAMMVLFVLRLQADTWTGLNWIMLITSAVLCLLVFRCFVFIFNFSYSLACVANAMWIAVQWPSMATALLSGAMIIYGLRLFWFTWSRVNSESYAPRVAHVNTEDAKLPVPVKAAIWLQCSFLYTFHLFAIYLVAERGVLSLSVWLATVVIIVGTVIEGLADHQKQKAKSQASQDFVSDGLYARWRHPNYAGEILVQLGLIIAGVGAATAYWGDFAAVVIAPLYIILLMIS